MLTAKKPFIAPRIFADRNFVAGLVIMFAVGMVLLSSSALLPPYLQRLGGYSVIETGLLMAPRGLGVMFAMVIAGRLTTHFDARALMLFGIATMSFTMWQMTAWTPELDQWSLIATSTLQGFGMGFVFIPLQIAAFATLPVEFRTDGASLFNLMRSIGSAIGVSIAVWLLSSGTAVMYSQLAEQVTPLNRLFHTGVAGLIFNPNLPMGLTAVNAEILRQAQIVAYANDFRFMFWISLPTALALLLMRKPARAMAPPDDVSLLD